MNDDEKPLELVVGAPTFYCAHCPTPWPAFEDQAGVDAHVQLEHPEVWRLFQKMKNVTISITRLIVPGWKQ